jgi:hypothetical protein
VTVQETFDPAPVLARFPDRTAADIAAYLGVGAASVAKWRAGLRGLPPAGADRIAVRLGVHPGELWPEWWQT